MFQLAFFAVQFFLYGVAVLALWLVLPGWAFGLIAALTLIPLALVIAQAFGMRWAEPLNRWLMTGKR